MEQKDRIEKELREEKKRKVEKKMKIPDNQVKEDIIRGQKKSLKERKWLNKEPEPEREKVVAERGSEGRR